MTKLSFDSHLQTYPKITVFEFSHNLSSTSEMAKALDVELKETAQTLLIKTTDNNPKYYALILRGDMKPDQEKVSCYIGHKPFEFLSPSEITTICDYPTNSIPPIALGDKITAVIMDNALMDQETVYTRTPYASKVTKIAPWMIQEINKAMVGYLTKS